MLGKKIRSKLSALRSLLKSIVRPPAFIDASSNQLVCYRLYGGHCERILSLDTAEMVKPLASGLIQMPGIVSFQQKYFDLRAPGVYRFYRLNDVSEQRLVLDGDFETILQCVGYLWTYGFERDFGHCSLEAAQLHKKILVASCGDISKIAKQICQTCGIDARVINFRSRQAWGGQDDGHVVLELRHPDGRWFIYDPSFAVIFVKKKQRLSAFELQQANRAKADYEIVRLPGEGGPSIFRHSNYDYGFWVSERFHSQNALAAWYRDILGIAIFSNENKHMFCSLNVDDHNIERMAAYGYVPIDEKRFRNLFYLEAV